MKRYVSFVIQSWQGSGDGGMRWAVQGVDDQEPRALPDASFLVRTWIDEDGQMVRGLIRHISSGREVQFQSGERAVEFIRAWMSDEARPAAELRETRGPSYG